MRLIAKHRTTNNVWPVIHVGTQVAITRSCFVDSSKDFDHSRAGVLQGYVMCSSVLPLVHTGRASRSNKARSILRAALQLPPLPTTNPVHRNQPPPTTPIARRLRSTLITLRTELFRCLVIRCATQEATPSEIGFSARENSSCNANSLKTSLFETTLPKPLALQRLCKHSDVKPANFQTSTAATDGFAAVAATAAASFAATAAATSLKSHFRQSDVRSIQDDEFLWVFSLSFPCNGDDDKPEGWREMERRRKLKEKNDKREGE
ncbi:hypothetical protein LSTR_LSTR003396 [Laodelphax striatellus]|uniref:Uncharacterized protein n=1 Tax=Laodelphax striatellus TaxID=195883 RepID=A0A482X5J4_LAOST|nr:hypothetical protein LSTR_LSTR003396 [Laodelphax striatellus]